MSRTIDYYFSMPSPWAFLGFERFHAIARRHGATIAYRPVNLGEVFGETGGLPLGKRHPARQAYRMIELQRWRDASGIPFALKPKGFPFDAGPADRITIALLEAGRSPESYLLAAHRAVWIDELDLSSPAVLAGILTRTGHPPDMVEVANSEEIRKQYEENRNRAIAGQVIGSPCYVLDGEVFWGQDRLDLLEAALTSGRPAFRAND
jgi:2-hydroxychromene-2-carboxylate isomerase